MMELIEKYSEYSITHYFPSSALSIFFPIINTAIFEKSIGIQADIAPVTPEKCRKIILNLK
ncbi:hypothetical protein GJA_2348 [Janthinobacterium agaricidamnosum NBRC 102515 = DSM 9628]|uniref:Uncharacterized protein n=1 Tax=Janthinobacterium agaricidamnosum NBRC 102515 = DSM 9628 TaxID=1349767 RepID=W0V6V5_9BURK|nr:hypothetical protein GJA_2348 [Janthinobacterium agaricidamnosum NBRC 102515 = DSM 9628]